MEQAECCTALHHIAHVDVMENQPQVHIFQMWKSGYRASVTNRAELVVIHPLHSNITHPP